MIFFLAYYFKMNVKMIIIIFWLVTVEARYFYKEDIIENKGTVDTTDTQMSDSGYFYVGDTRMLISLINLVSRYLAVWQV